MDPGKNEDFAHDSIASTCDLPLVEADEYDDAFLNMAVLKSQIAEDGSAPVSATQCVLYWCINTYETRVLGGQLIEKTLDSWKSTTGGPSISDEIRTLTPPPVNPTIAPSNFTLDLFEVEKLSSRLATSLNFSNSYALQEIADSNEKLRVPDVSNRIDYTGIPANYNLIRLFQDYDTVDIIQNLAKSMTTHIRSVDNSKVTSESYAYLNITADGPVKGTVYHLQVYVAIRWLWLAFPACLLIFTFLFFVLVVIQSAFSGVAVWKSSPLAILFHGLSSSSVEQIQGATELADMEKHAKGMKVRFQDAHLAAVSEE
jgi:hypothetical protein